ncbi:unnamed protein product [Effrenium voratum]|uniref:Uncharacterized protein n=1 Tax=Effrenium voratum TaxID=2562239 RepID=A0AA36JLJ0_9DINO|nr:unnamed protein product [Effrenium voratum]
MDMRTGACETHPLQAFGELYTKRKRHTLLFQNYETYTQLFQALPVEVATEKSLLPLMRCYRRMKVSHDPFVRAVAWGMWSLRVSQQGKVL